VVQKNTAPIESGCDLEARIVQTFRSVHPKKIILFGSVARNEADPYSDIDIIIVYQTQKRFLDRLEELYRHWNIRRAVDILAYTPDEYEDLLRESDFIRDAVEKGRVIYEDV
jgi:predicted nucleotidyltransferase